MIYEVLHSTLEDDKELLRLVALVKDHLLRQNFLLLDVLAQVRDRLVTEVFSQKARVLQLGAV